LCEEEIVNVLCIGAHPDDCEIKFGGTAAKFAAGGHAVKFVSVTNGQSGHRHKFGPELIEIRRKEAAEGARRLAIAESQVLENPDGALQPDLARREQIIRQIRNWRADVVLTHRPCDYHPDHRYTAQLVQDAAYMVVVPAVCSDTSALRINPAIFHLEDDFQLPNPHQPDVAVSIDETWDQKIFAMDAHVSQFYEWLPDVDGKSDQVPSDSDGNARRQWLGATWTRPIRPIVRELLNARYGAKGSEIQRAESFQLCEYGRQPSRQEVNQMFPR
jgi:LmbE family N-acetylglucosaminyl deacetylase